MNERNTELQSIKNIIDLYVEGVRTGDIEKLRTAFHPKAMMYGASPNGAVIVEIEGLYGFIAANEPPSRTGEQYQCSLTSIHYAGNAASVELVEESAFGNDYTDYFQLLKIDGKWMIVSKAYNSSKSEK